MIAHAVCALLALAALPTRAQDATIFVDVQPNTDEPEDVEKRYTPELIEELQSARDDALLMYTEYTGRSGMELRDFLHEMTGYANKTIGAMNDLVLIKASKACRGEFETKLKKIEDDTKQLASISGVTHHKFLQGHMVVLRMHLNKSADYIRKCDHEVKRCGIRCETNPRVRRWRRHAADELHRVRDDLQHSRKSYRDILTHELRYLRRLRRDAIAKVREATDEFLYCE